MFSVIMIVLIIIIFVQDSIFLTRLLDKTSIYFITDYILLLTMYLYRYTILCTDTMFSEHCSHSIISTVTESNNTYFHNLPCIICVRIMLYCCWIKRQVEHFPNQNAEGKIQTKLSQSVLTNCDDLSTWLSLNGFQWNLFSLVFCWSAFGSIRITFAPCVSTVRIIVDDAVGFFLKSRHFLKNNLYIVYKVWRGLDEVGQVSEVHIKYSNKGLWSSRYRT